MRKHLNSLWLLGVLTAIAFGFGAFSEKHDEVSVPPLTRAAGRSPSPSMDEALDPAIFHIHQFALGARSMDVHLKWRDLGQTDGWETFGFKKTDDTGAPYFFLAAKFDSQGLATTLRGTSIGYESNGESGSLESLKASKLLPPPIILNKSAESEHSLELYPSLGLAVHYLNDNVSEYYLIDPASWNKLRIDNCGLFRPDSARIFLSGPTLAQSSPETRNSRVFSKERKAGLTIWGVQPGDELSGPRRLDSKTAVYN